jgi:hypothetical protein
MATGKKTWNKLTDDQKKNTYSSYTGVAPEHVDLTGMDYNDLPKDVKKGVKQSQLKAKLLKMKLAESDYQTRNRLDKAKSPMSKEVPFGKDKRNKNQIRDDVLDKTISEAKGTKIRPKTPTNADRRRIITAKAKVNKLKKKTSIPDEIMQEASDAAGLNKNQSPSYIAKEHHHKISFRGHKIGGFKGASLNGQSGKYAKYWLLNAKETNGNGWGIAAHTAKENMKKFIGRPLVVTAQSWHGASEYGDEYEHPYLPTNDINAILNHQEKFRVGSIVDVFEDKHGDWYASIEMLPKFASSRLPPFCSPAIYQLDASEAEGQISKWEALHLAALTENPAYGARIALLKGTCVGTDNECKVQFKSAKQESGIECPVKEKQKKVKSKLSKLKKKQKVSKIKARLAGLGEQNMTYQESKKVKIHKKKHPEVRKAKSSVEDILRGQGRSVDGTHHESTFLSTKGDFIGGGDSHAGQALSTDNTLSEILDVNGNQDIDGIVERFSSDNNIPKVQHFPINRAGEKKTSVGIFSKINSTQLKSLKDIEEGGGTLGFAVGTSTSDIDGMSTGEGYRDLTKALKERKFLG